MITKIIYIDEITGEIINIPKYKIKDYDIKILEINYIKNKNYGITKEITKAARPTRQTKIEW